jgi:hypothetical protein
MGGIVAATSARDNHSGADLAVAHVSANHSTRCAPKASTATRANAQRHGWTVFKKTP